MGIDALRRDHIIPVGAPGSGNSIDNLQPLCQRCNSNKGRRVIDLRQDKSSLSPDGCKWKVRRVQMRLKHLSKTRV